jgi:hypothetical protein
VLFLTDDKRQAAPIPPPTKDVPACATLTALRTLEGFLGERDFDAAAKFQADDRNGCVFLVAGLDLIHDETPETGYALVHVRGSPTQFYVPSEFVKAE